MFTKLVDSAAVLERLIEQTVLLIQDSSRLNVEKEALRKFPCFFSCYWHSAVHSHWQIIAGLSAFPQFPFTSEAKRVLHEHISACKIEQELATIRAKGERFEMPYGMAWALLLSAYLYQKQEEFQKCYEAMKPLESWAISLFSSFCDRNDAPVRSGLHNQTAFSLIIALEASKILGNLQLSEKIECYVQNQFLSLKASEVTEPLGTDFLSPTLAECVLVGKILPKAEYVAWLEKYVGETEGFYFDSLFPVQVHDPVMQCHLVGLNFSRCWMLNQMAGNIPQHPRGDSLKSNALRHFNEGMVHATNTDLMITHWIPTFALYASLSFQL